jgi:transposase-like protein
MARPGIPKEQKEKEGATLKKAFLRQQGIEPGLTQESLVAELGRTSQGLFYQWTAGITAIPDDTLIALGRRLGFDAVALRPSLKKYYQSSGGADSKSELLQEISASSDAEADELLRYLRFIKASRDARK